MAETKALGVLEFQTRIKGAVRPNLFSVTHNFPTGIIAEDGLETFMCKSAALPASTVGTVELPFRGRVIKVPGDRTFESWTATFYMDDAFQLRGAYEKWIELTTLWMLTQHQYQWKLYYRTLMLHRWISLVDPLKSSRTSVSIN